MVPKLTSRLKHCIFCDKVFSRGKYSLEMHMNSHTNERPFQCEECNANFRSDAALFTHRRNMHGNISASSDSDSDTSSINEIGGSGKKHLLIVKFNFKKSSRSENTTEKAQDNEITTRRTNTVKSSDKVSERRFPCSHCDANFSSSQNLKVHTDSTHLGKKIKYECICQKTFTYRSALYVHQKKRCRFRKQSVSGSKAPVANDTTSGPIASKTADNSRRSSGIDEIKLKKVSVRLVDIAKILKDPSVSILDPDTVVESEDEEHDSNLQEDVKVKEEDEDDEHIEESESVNDLSVTPPSPVSTELSEYSDEEKEKAGHISDDDDLFIPVGTSEELEKARELTTSPFPQQASNSEIHKIPEGDEEKAMDVEQDHKNVPLPSALIGFVKSSAQTSLEKCSGIKSSVTAEDFGGSQKIQELTVKSEADLLSGPSISTSVTGMKISNGSINGGEELMKSYQHKSNQIAHARIDYTVRKKNQCYFCHAHFSRKSKMMRHIEADHRMTLLLAARRAVNLRKL